MKERVNLPIAFSVVLTLLVLLSACGSPRSTPTPTAPPLSAVEGEQWAVYNSDGIKVLIVINEPGPITSTATPPPGFEPPKHPFLTGSALDPSEEDELRKLLDQSTSFADYLARLYDAGYVLVKEN